MLLFADRSDRRASAAAAGSGSAAAAGATTTATNEGADEGATTTTADTGAEEGHRLARRGDIDAACAAFRRRYERSGGQAADGPRADWCQLLEICGRHDEAVAALRRAPSPHLLSRLLLLKLLYIAPQPLTLGALDACRKLVASIERDDTVTVKKSWTDARAMGSDGCKSHWAYFVMVRELLRRERRLPTGLRLLLLRPPAADSQHGGRKPLHVVGDSHVVPFAHRVISWRGKAWYLVPHVVTGLKAWHVHRGTGFFTGTSLRRVLGRIRDGAATEDGVARSSILMSAGEIDVREGLARLVSEGGEGRQYASLAEAVRRTVSAYLSALVRLAEEFNCVFYVLPLLPSMRRANRGGQFKARETRQLARRLWNEALRSENVPGRRLGLVVLEYASADMCDGGGQNLLPALSLDGTHASARFLPILERALECAAKCPQDRAL